MTAKKVENLYCLFVFGWIKLKFGVRGDSGFLKFQIVKGRYQIKKRGNHVVNISHRQACCKGVTEEEAARNISTFLSAPIV